MTDCNNSDDYDYFFDIIEIQTLGNYVIYNTMTLDEHIYCEAAFKFLLNLAELCGIAQRELDEEGRLHFDLDNIDDLSIYNIERAILVWAHYDLLVERALDVPEELRLLSRTGAEALLSSETTMLTELIAMWERESSEMAQAQERRQFVQRWLGLS